MPFGYEYWIVYLPEFNPDSFLLFVHNSAGSTKLRDYSNGRERVLGQPRLDQVRQATEWGRTRFEESPHTVSGQDGECYWHPRIAEYNRRWLGLLRNGIGEQNAALAPPARAMERKGAGRATRGSQRQLQDYVNLAPSLLDEVILSALPIRIQQSFPRIRWVSPLAADEFCELRDAAFLSALGLGQFAKELNSFWPAFGPCWDALAILTTSLQASLPIAILVEAKSHVQEVYGNGCQAAGNSRALIESSLSAAKRWCDARADADWTGPLYQCANRISHLYFMRQRLNCPCFLINLYFVDDPYRPTSQSEWLTALRAVHRELGLTTSVPGLIEVFLPGRAVEDDRESPSAGVEIAAGALDESRCHPEGAANARAFSGGSSQPPPNEELSFAAWCKRWELLGAFEGPILPQPEERIRRVWELWQHEIPGRWKRGIDPQLLGSRYRRGDLERPRPGEHTIEYQILVERFGRISLLGGNLVDGVNAFPLACDFAGGGRRGNVEADMLLMVQSAGSFRLALCEVKADANDPWYAAVEALRQMRLFLSNPIGHAVMQRRGALPPNVTDAPLTGLVLAPAEYYCASGKRRNAVKPTKKLFEQMRHRCGVDLRLAVWEPALNQIRDL